MLQVFQEAQHRDSHGKPRYPALLPPQPQLPPPSPVPHVPGGEAGLAALAAAGVQSRAIVEEAAQCQLLPDGLALILLRLQGKERREVSGGQWGHWHRGQARAQGGSAPGEPS